MNKIFSGLAATLGLLVSINAVAIPMPANPVCIQYVTSKNSAALFSGAIASKGSAAGVAQALTQCLQQDFCTKLGDAAGTDCGSTLAYREFVANYYAQLYQSGGKAAAAAPMAHTQFNAVPKTSSTAKTADSKAKKNVVTIKKKKKKAEPKINWF